MKTLHPGLSFLLLIIIGATIAPAADFQVGNLNPPVTVWGENGVSAPSEYAYLIFPPDQAQCDQGGFIVEAIHMMLEFPPVMVGQTFQVSAALYSAELDPSDSMLKPGFPICDSLPVVYTVTGPGIATVSVLLDPCVPVVFNDTYFLVMRFMSPLEAGLPIDGLPQPGIVYLNDGAGWIDMFSGLKTPAGKSIIWGDITCAVPPIPVGDGTWSDIKSLYR